MTSTYDELTPAGNDDRMTAVVILTRPAAQSLACAVQLSRWACGASRVRILLSPLLKIVPVAATEDAADFAAIVLTSANALSHYGGTRAGRAYCVGPRTTDAARRAGFDAYQAGDTAGELAAHLEAHPKISPLLYLRGTHSSHDLAGQLRQAGVRITESVTYDQQAQSLSPAARAAFDGEAPVILPLYSVRSARLLCDEIGGRHDAHAPLYVAALSDSVAQTAARLRAREINVPSQPNGAAMSEEISRLVARAQLACG